MTNSGAPDLPGYTFVQHLGSGGFADVFLYEQQWPQQRVAVKVLRPDLPLTEREKAMFTAEANAMATLADHPYIVSVITAGVTGPEQGGQQGGQSGGRPYLVMRYCPPPDLGVRVRTSPMSVADAVSTGVKLASAVETAHRAGIVHRDIKPSNVLVTTYQEPALTDFGIAGHLHEMATETEVRISYPWSPPELLDGRSNGSVASDVYSLGATIWNLLTGRSPYAVPHGDNSARALTARILHAEPPPTMRPDAPPSLERLLAQCLAKDPSHRPASALELARALQRIEAEAGFSRTPIAVEGDRPSSAPLTPSGPDPDATYVKAITVIPASGPRASRIEQGSTGRRPDVVEPAPSRSGLVWAVVGGLVIAAVAAFVLLRGGDTEADPDPTIPTSARTPLPVAPSAPQDPPDVTVTRTGQKVVFVWKVRGGVQPTDSWDWTRTGTGDGQRTAETRLVLRSPERLCVQVRLIRGAYASPYTEKCAE